MKERLKLLRAEASDLQEKLSNNSKEQTELMIAIYKDDTKLAVGDKVLVDGKKKGVIESFVRKYSEVMPNVQYYKKDGTLGKRYERVWGFQKIEKLSE